MYKILFKRTKMLHKYMNYTVTSMIEINLVATSFVKINSFFFRKL